MIAIPICWINGPTLTGQHRLSTWNQRRRLIYRLLYDDHLHSDGPYPTTHNIYSRRNGLLRQLPWPLNHQSHGLYHQFLTACKNSGGIVSRQTAAASMNTSTLRHVIISPHSRQRTYRQGVLYRTTPRALLRSTVHHCSNVRVQPHLQTIINALVPGPRLPPRAVYGTTAFPQLPRGQYPVVFLDQSPERILRMMWLANTAETMKSDPLRL